MWKAFPVAFHLSTELHSRGRVPSHLENTFLERNENERNTTYRQPAVEPEWKSDSESRESKTSPAKLSSRGLRNGERGGKRNAAEQRVPLSAPLFVSVVAPACLHFLHFGIRTRSLRGHALALSWICCSPPLRSPNSGEFNDTVSTFETRLPIALDWTKCNKVSQSLRLS